MKALLDLVDTAADLSRVRAICARKKAKILHRKHGVEMTDKVASEGITTNFGGYGSHSGVHLGERFGDHWCVAPDDPKGSPFARISVHLAGDAFDRPRE